MVESGTRVDEGRNRHNSDNSMLHVVEVRFSGEPFRDFLDRVRGWCQANTQPTTFRYWLHEPDTLLRVNFESQDQARAFAQAFGGVVLA